MPSAEPTPGELADWAADWAASGSVWLTGRPDGPPLVPPGRGATWIRESLASLGLRMPGLLGERAAYLGLGRSAPWSCGGAFRILAGRDGWLGVSLSRPSDLELVPALVQASPQAEDPWDAVAAWAARTGVVEAEERLRLLGLPGGAVPEQAPRDRPGVVTTVLGARRHASGPAVVVDLTGLWAGPLCAHLLGLGGARVVKVESATRPDGARQGSPEFFELLHAGHEQLRLDLRADVDQLRRLVAEADLVLEASRPRALRQLGLDAEEVVAAGTSWLSITARGRASDAVGFGDDVAASAGLVVRPDGVPIPAGDALADPLAGVAAAVAAHEALASDEARLIDVSMLHVAAETVPDPGARSEPLAAVDRGDGSWWVPTDRGDVRVERPRRRGPS